MNFSRSAIGGMLLAAAALPASASSEGGGGGASTLLQPQIGTIFWTLVTFLFLAWLLSKFAWKPLLGALNEREQAIQATIEQAERERSEAGDMLAQQKELVTQARRERAEALSAGQKDAERLKAEILDEARKQPVSYTHLRAHET